MMCMLSTTVRAQADLPWRSVVWDDRFTVFDPSNYYLGTDSRHDAASGSFLLTPENQGQAGRLYLTRPLPIDYFDLTFRARFGVNAPFNDSGADGIAFVLAGRYDYPPAYGGALDFDGCQGYGLEFDTFENTDLADPSPEHIAVIRNRSDNHLLSETLTIPTLEDGGWHNILVRFQGGYVEAWLDGVRRLNTDIAGFLPFEGFFGFTAATGTAYNEHRIDDIHLSMPTRRAMDFGSYSVCKPIVIDTVLFLRNNLLIPAALTVTDIALRSATPGIFSLTTNPAPFTLPTGGTREIPVRVTLSSVGTYSAVLEIHAENGETVYDTLRISGDIPRLRFEPASYTFAVTRTGRTRDVDVILRNSGTLPVTLEGLRFSGSSFRVRSPSAFPVTIAAGAALPVQLRFAPLVEGLHTDTLRVTNACGSFIPLALDGTSLRESVTFSFFPRILLLQPGSRDEVVLRVDSLPRFTEIRRLEGVVLSGNMFAEYLGASIPPGPVPAGSTIDIMEGAPGRIVFTIDMPAPLADTGAVLSLRFGGMVAGPPCDTLILPHVRLNGDSLLTTAPELDAAPGRICVNGSCRHPFGLYALPDPEFRVVPHPAVHGTRVEIDLPAEGMIDLRLRDLLGRTRAVLAKGIFAEGAQRFSLPLTGLPAGCYILELDWQARRLTRTLLVR